MARGTPSSTCTGCRSKGAGVAVAVLLTTAFVTWDRIMVNRGQRVLNHSERKEPLVANSGTAAKLRIAAVGVYDPSWPRPKGLSPDQAASLGLFVKQGGLSAWESEAHIDTFHNIGNLIWSLGAYQLLRWQDLVMNRSLWATAAVDVLYIATGPMFGGHYYGIRASAILDALQAVEKPTVVVGMGIDPATHDLACSGFGLNEKDKPLLDGLQNRITKLGGFVGVRGACSERLLRQQGYTVFETLGCPSLFINQRPQLGARLEKKYKSLARRAKKRDTFKVAIAMPDKYHEAVVPFLVRVLARYPGSELVVQSRQEASHIDRAVKELGILRPQRALRVFYDAWEWRKAMTSFDLVLAARIHGSMAGIAAETPVVTFPMDMRILEMCEAMELARVLPSDPDLWYSELETLLTAVASKFNGSAFDARRFALAARYRELFRALNVKGVLNAFKTVG